jgi:KUP system potassium uptake protein
LAFLTTRVKGPDTDDEKKLHRVIKYLRSTLHMPLVLEADGTHVIKWWADASFAVYPDMKSHTGGLGSLGKGAVMSVSSKQKLNSTSSTEGELISASDLMPKVIWTRYFLDAQGYSVEDNILNQDNMSSIKLEQNGQASSGKRTRHIHIRYFFVKDRIDGKELRVAYCPTEEMIADFFTKPLQGVLFRKFRDQIMNVDPETDWSQDHRSVLDSDPERESESLTATANVTTTSNWCNQESTWHVVGKAGRRTSSRRANKAHS